MVFRQASWRHRADPRKRRFAELEVEIIAGIKATFFVSVMVKACLAAQEVRQTGLFRDAGHATWGECCRQRWQFEEGEADEIISIYTQGCPSLDGWSAKIVREKYKRMKAAQS